MSALMKWLDHRMEVVGVESWKDLAEQSGVPLVDLQDARMNETLDALNRSDQRYLAAVLRVSLSKLDRLNEGEVDWIDDSHVYDAVSRGRPRPCPPASPAVGAPP